MLQHKDFGIVKKLADSFVTEKRNATVNAAILSLVLVCFVVDFEWVHAQEAPFKGKTIRVVVGFPSGGGSDAEGRVLARHLGK